MVRAWEGVLGLFVTRKVVESGNRVPEREKP